MNHISKKARRTYSPLSDNVMMFFGEALPGNIFSDDVKANQSLSEDHQKDFVLVRRLTDSLRDYGKVGNPLTTHDRWILEGNTDGFKSKDKYKWKSNVSTQFYDYVASFGLGRAVLDCPETDDFIDIDDLPYCRIPIENHDFFYVSLATYDRFQRSVKYRCFDVKNFPFTYHNPAMYARGIYGAEKPLYKYRLSQLCDDICTYIPKDLMRIVLEYHNFCEEHYAEPLRLYDNVVEQFNTLTEDFVEYMNEHVAMRMSDGFQLVVFQPWGDKGENFLKFMEESKYACNECKITANIDKLLCPSGDIKYIKRNRIRVVYDTNSPLFGKHFEDVFMYIYIRSRIQLISPNGLTKAWAHYRASPRNQYSLMMSN